MTTTINASTSSGLIVTSDTSGTLALQSNGSTIASVGSSGMTINSYVAGTSMLTNATAQNSTSGTSIDFTSIPSWVKRITVMFNGVSTNGTSYIQLQLGAGSPTTTGYKVNGGYFGSTSASTAVTTGFQLIGFALASDIMTGQFTFCLLNSNIWTGSGTFFDETQGGYIGICAGKIALSGTLDRIRITTVNGTDTFDAGSINIQYE